jgi:hypothetical protein
MAKKSLAGRLLGGVATVAKFAGDVCLLPVALLAMPFIALFIVPSPQANIRQYFSF